MSAKKTSAAQRSACLLESPGGRWSITRAEPGTTRRTTRGSAAAAASDDVLPGFLTRPDFEVLDRIEARPAAERRGVAGAGASMVPLTATVPADAAVLLVVRQASGAVSFLRPTAVVRTRRGLGGVGELQVVFEVPVLDGDPTVGRRGPLSKVVRAVLVKVADKLIGELVDHAAEWLMPKLASLLEERIWKNRAAGWLRVTPQGLADPDDHLAAGVPAFHSPERGLLLIHGTFSTAHAGFRHLAGTDFFQHAASLYGGNVFAFNHLTFSRTPAENVGELLDALPDQDFEFDVITHSRGGLVARELLEGAGLAHPQRNRLKIGKVILVASPCTGTPLASEAQWSSLLSTVANLLEMLPDNPFTTGGAWLAEALKWFAVNVVGNCPGLAVMDPQSEFIDTIQTPPGAPAGVRYHALTSNYQPEEKFLGRVADMGIDSLFGGANDLVVPSEGSWKTGDEPAAWIPAARIACYGPGGNLSTAAAVHHCNYFGQAETAAFLLACLRGEPPDLPALDPAAALPSRNLRITRSFAGPSARAMPEARLTPDVGSLPAVAKTAAPAAPAAPEGWNREDEFSLTVVSNTAYATVKKEESGTAVPLLVARYGSARVVVPFYTRGSDDNAGKRWHQIIASHQELVKYANGEEARFSPGNTEGPTAAFLEEFGEVLFRTLFPGEVRSLYDIARFGHRKRRLKIVFSSTIPWVADIPWEFAFDRAANSFLCCGDVRFVRNVLTPIPANKIEERPGALRILVVSAQPPELGRLSIEDERRGIYESFRPLIDAGLVTVEVLASATPALLHERLRYQPDGGEFDVLHFIGHGEFDEKAGTGYLVFQDDTGGIHRVSASTFLNIVQGRDIRIVFLNACETGQGRQADYNRGVAMALVRDGIPAVVANQYSVIDRSASQFSLHFYSCLAQGLNLGDAMREARIAMHYCGVELIDWGVPVLFATNPDARLCPPGARPPAAAGESAAICGVMANATRTVRGSTGLRRTSVAVWDAENSLVYRENLQATLEELNAAQDAFTFRIERFSAPRNLWTPDKNPATDGVAYLPAERVVERMERIRKAISKTVRTDYLFCVTNLPLREANATALYFLAANRITILSTWNLEPPLEGARLKRALANHLAIALLQHLSGVNTGCEKCNDPRHPIHTVGYYNNERSVAHITGPMAITPETLSLIHQAIAAGGMITADQFKAIQALLACYHPT